LKNVFKPELNKIDSLSGWDKEAEVSMAILPISGVQELKSPTNKSPKKVVNFESNPPSPD
jgi:hypothetical protein